MDGFVLRTSDSWFVIR